MIVVTGATGQLGRHVVAELLSQGVPAGQIVAAVRDTAKAADLGVEVRHADYTDPASLKTAFAGADQVLLISTSVSPTDAPGSRLTQHRNVVDAAREAGVDFLAYTSVLRADTTTLGLAAEHKATEEYIRESGLPHSFLRNGWYIENYNVASALEHGTFLGSAKDGRIAAATRADYAAAAARVLTDPNRRAEVYELVGDTPFTMTELAAEVTAQSGTQVTYTDLSQPDYFAALTQAGLPKAYADLLSDSDVGVSKGELDSDSTDLVDLIGRPSTPLADVVRDAVKA